MFFLELVIVLVWQVPHRLLHIVLLLAPASASPVEFFVSSVVLFRSSFCWPAIERFLVFRCAQRTDLTRRGLWKA